MEAPLARQQPSPPRKPRRPWLSLHEDVLLGVVAHTVSSFNLLSLTFAIQVLDILDPYTPMEYALVTASFFAGDIAGALVAGWVGDWLGLKSTLAIVLAVQCVSTAGCCLSQSPNIYMKLFFWRFFAGSGSGGTIPLVVSLAKESPGSTAATVVLVETSQVVGFSLAALACWVLSQLFSTHLCLLWRLLLGLGGLGAALVAFMAATSTSGNTALPRASGEGRAATRARAWAMLGHRENVLLVLRVVAAVSVFSFTYSGVALYQPEILEYAFGAMSHSDLGLLSGEELLIQLLAFPGVYLALKNMNALGPRFIQVVGYVAMGLVLLIIGLGFSWVSSNGAVLVALYGLVFVFSTFGPSVTGYVLMATLFPEGARATMTGVAAAIMRTVAVGGILSFSPLANALGLGPMLALAGLLCLGGAAATVALLPNGVDGKGSWRQTDTDGPASVTGTSSDYASCGHDSAVHPGSWLQSDPDGPASVTGTSSDFASRGHDSAVTSSDYASRGHDSAASALHPAREPERGTSSLSVAGSADPGQPGRPRPGPGPAGPGGQGRGVAGVSAGQAGFGVGGSGSGSPRQASSWRRLDPEGGVGAPAAAIAAVRRGARTGGGAHPASGGRGRRFAQGTEAAASCENRDSLREPMLPRGV